MALNRYARLRRHKLYLKRRHAKAYGRWDIREDERKEHEFDDKIRRDTRHCGWHDSRNRGYTYWKNFYLSGCRKYAKQSTNGRIRAKYRQLASKNVKDEYLADVVAPRGSDYEKEYDYLWTIY